MRLVHVSDTHNMLDQVSIPKGDLLVHSGDWTGLGTIQEIARFNEQLGKVRQRFKHGIIVVPGNHDGLAEENAALCRDTLTNATLLIDQEVTVDGLRIYGSPHTPAFANWWFNSTPEQLVAQWDSIPNGLDILITHGPPYGILDTLRSYNLQTGQQSIRMLGCQILRKAVEDKKPRLHLFGHIHDGYGTKELDGVWYSNGSVCTEQYSPVNNPKVFNITKKSISLVRGC